MKQRHFPSKQTWTNDAATSQWLQFDMSQRNLSSSKFIDDITNSVKFPTAGPRSHVCASVRLDVA